MSNMSDYNFINILILVCSIICFFSVFFTFNKSNLTLVNLAVFIFSLVGYVMTIILIIYNVHNNNTHKILNFIKNLFPIILSVISLVSVIMLNIYYTIKINDNILPNPYYTFNTLYIGVLCLQFGFIYYHLNKNIKNGINNIYYLLADYALSLIIVIFAVIQWIEVIYFTTDG
jgi:hypothetical protein